MSVVIRLTRIGKKGEARYRVVVKEKRSKRDGKAIEILGWFDKTTNPPKTNVKEERLRHWIANGAQPSAIVSKLLK